MFWKAYDKFITWILHKNISTYNDTKLIIKSLKFILDFSGLKVPEEFCNEEAYNS